MNYLVIPEIFFIDYSFRGAVRELRTNINLTNCRKSLRKNYQFHNSYILTFYYTHLTLSDI